MFVNEDKLRKMIKEAVVEALSAEITWEKRRDEKTGLPLAVPEYIKEEVFLPAFWAQNIKFQEAAFRGVQEDLGKKQGEISDATKKIEALANFLISAEPVFRQLAKFSKLIEEKQQCEQSLIGTSS
jgi:hypothetical protein